MLFADRVRAEGLRERHRARCHQRGEISKANGWGLSRALCARLKTDG